jgi:hypothetical protein
MKKMDRESGITLFIVAISMSFLLGIMAFAMDLGVLFHDRRNAQTAADAAAIAAAGDLSYGATVAEAAGQAAAKQNGFTNGSNGVTVTINTPVTDDSNAAFNNASHVEAIVELSDSTPFMNAFMHLFNSSSTFTGMTVGARAVAENGASSAEQCVLTLNPTGAGNPNAAGADIYFSGAASITSPDCGFEDDSNASNALYMNGAFSMDLQSVGVVGGDSITGAVSWTGATPTLDQASYSDPLNYLDEDEPSVPSTSSCPTLNYSGAGTYTITAGCYNGITISGSSIVTFSGGNYTINTLTIEGASNVTFDAGLYTITNSAGTANTGLNITGSSIVNGTGVTFYLTDGAGVDLTTGAYNVTLSAPTSGTWNGILFFENPADTAQFNVSGAAVLNWQGIVYLPSANVDWTGATSGTLYTDFVVSTFSDTGALSLNDYAQKNSNNPLVKLTLALVE